MKTMICMIFFSVFFNAFSSGSDNEKSVIPIEQWDIYSDHSNCNWRHNITDTTWMHHHEYSVLEECLYYYLMDKEVAKSKVPYALKIVAPIKNPGDTVSLTVNSATIVRVEPHVDAREMFTMLKFRLSWTDSRLTWNVADWKVDSLKIYTDKHLWTPDIRTPLYTSMSNRDFLTLNEMQADSQGLITAQIEMSAEAECEMDFSDYPKSRANCCVQLTTFLYKDIVRWYVAENFKTGTDKNYNGYSWIVKKMEATVLMDESDHTQQLQFCFHARRQAGTLKMEYSLPMAASAFLVILAPIFGDLRTQNYVKMFSLLLQMICFQFLAYRTPSIGFSGSQPKIYRFYEFSLAVTLLSLFIGVVLGAFSRIERKVPVPHTFYLLAQMVNLRLCCAKSSGEHRNSVDPEQAELTGQAFQDQWGEVFVAINNLISLLILAIYILGVLVLVV